MPNQKREKAKANAKVKGKPIKIGHGIFQIRKKTREKTGRINFTGIEVSSKPLGLAVFKLDISTWEFSAIILEISSTP